MLITSLNTTPEIVSLISTLYVYQLSYIHTYAELSQLIVAISGRLWSKGVSLDEKLVNITRFISVRRLKNRWLAFKWSWNEIRHTYIWWCYEWFWWVLEPDCRDQWAEASNSADSVHTFSLLGHCVVCVCHALDLHVPSCSPRQSHSI